MNFSVVQYLKMSIEARREGNLRYADSMASAALCKNANLRGKGLGSEIMDKLVGRFNPAHRNDYAVRLDCEAFGRFWKEYPQFRSNKRRLHKMFCSLSVAVASLERKTEGELWNASQAIGDYIEYGGKGYLDEAKQTLKAVRGMVRELQRYGKLDRIEFFESRIQNLEARVENAPVRRSLYQWCENNVSATQDQTVYEDNYVYRLINAVGERALSPYYFEGLTVTQEGRKPVKAIRVRKNADRARYVALH